jgi:hypothetical protein
LPSIRRSILAVVDVLHPPPRGAGTPSLFSSASIPRTVVIPAALNFSTMARDAVGKAPHEIGQLAPLDAPSTAASRQPRRAGGIFAAMPKPTELPAAFVPTTTPADLLRVRRPYTAALQLAASRTIEDLEARVEDGSRVALVALGEVLVLKALRSDVAAHGIIAERLEGRVGTRADEVAPETLAAREASQATVHELIEAFTSAKLQLGDSPSEIATTGALAQARADAAEDDPPPGADVDAPDSDQPASADRAAVRAWDRAP